MAIDGPFITFVGCTLDIVKQLRTAVNFSGILSQCFKQVEFKSGKLYFLLSRQDLAFFKIEHNISQINQIAFGLAVYRRSTALTRDTNSLGSKGLLM